MEVALIPDEVVSDLWAEYKRTKEFKEGNTEAIPAHHLLVENREAEGLRSIYKKFVRTLKTNKNIQEEFRNRRIGDWLEEWKEMHRLLFGKILVSCGSFRQKDVRFGNPWDDWGIPDYVSVTRQTEELAYEISASLNAGYVEDFERFKVLARIHFEFVRIHPFVDGNGRIARAVVDQIAVCFGYPPAMGGYPRTTLKRRQEYHRAMKACIGDRECRSLAKWIKGYVERRSEMIA
jgi:Fic family protein